jgi:hypothetical protein
MLELKLRRVGSSLGVLLPKLDLERSGLKEGDTIVVPRLAPKEARDLYGVWSLDPVRLEFLEE